MISRAQVFVHLAAFCGGLLAAARAEAQLVAKSPFMTAAVGGSAAPTTGAPLEFRGTMETSEGLKVRIVDPARKAGVWLLANERDPGFDFVVKQIDADHDTVTIDYQGRPLTLAQHVAKVASAGVAQNFPGGPGGNGGPPMPAAITNSVVLNPTPADEQKRLDAVAAEVARRRALREQASQQVSQGVPLAPQVIQQQQDLRAQQQNAQQNGQQQNNGAQRGGLRQQQRGARGTPE